ncbi:MAG TPA: hypothetical protein VHZ50_05075 [Puia sp.]|jgi:hypothetical protein|nr:hypothetical protein [Puia sp.]
MKLSSFAIIVAIISIGYGLSLLIIPIKFLEPYGYTLNDHGALIARGYGIVLCQVGIIFWFSRNIPGTERSWRILLAATLFFNAVSTPVELIAISNGVVNGMGWVTVATRVIIGGSCIYFLFRKNK